MFLLGGSNDLLRARLECAGMLGVGEGRGVDRVMRCFDDGWGCGGGEGLWVLGCDVLGRSAEVDVYVEYI